MALINYIRFLCQNNWKYNTVTLSLLSEAIVLHETSKFIDHFQILSIDGPAKLCLSIFFEFWKFESNRALERLFGATSLKPTIFVVVKLVRIN